MDESLVDKRLLPPLTRRTSAYKISRLVVLADGSTMPVLRFLAKELRPGGWDEEKEIPIWTDGDFMNEERTNVSFVNVVTDPMKRKSKYGIPSGTAEYRKKWREEHPDAVRRAAKKAYERRKALVAKGKQAEEIAAGLGGTELLQDLQVQNDREDLIRKLEELTDEAADSASQEEP